MNKNTIKQYLTKTFITEAKAKTDKSTSPGIKLAKKMGKEDGKINKDGLKAISKDMKSYESNLTKPDSKQSSMATNKFNYTDDAEKTYHDEMEIMNGQEMVQYDRPPSNDFKDRAKEAIAGSSRMGNNPKWANVVAKGQGGDPEFGANLVKSIEASEKKRNEQTPTSKMFGNDWEIVKDKGHKSYAFENTKKKEIMTDNDIMNKLNEMMGFDDESQNDRQVQSGINPYSDNNEMSSIPEKLFDTIVNVDSSNVDRCREEGIVVLCEKDGQEMVIELCVEVGHKEMTQHQQRGPEQQGIEGGQLESIEFDIIGGTIDGMRISPKDVQSLNRNEKEYEVYDELNDKIYKLLSNKVMSDYRSMSETSYNFNENKNNNKKPIKESMKRLKFKKEFNGVGNALKLIPESYRVDNKVFEMTDGNESYRIRWEGTFKSGNAVILTASDKEMMNEDIQKMKHLMGYKPQDTLGLVKGKARINENNEFNTFYNKTKKLLGETEDIDGQDAESEGQFDDADINQAAEAKKHVQGSTSTDKGTVAPKPKLGTWDKISVPHAAEAKKHIQGSTSDSKGTVAPKPKLGNFDTKKPQSPEAKKHMQGSVKK